MVSGTCNLNRESWRVSIYVEQDNVVTLTAQYPRLPVRKLDMSLKTRGEARAGVTGFKIIGKK